MSEEFNNFIGIIIIIGFALIFWNDFKEGKITQTPSASSTGQTISADTSYPQGPIQSAQYIPAQ